MADEPTPDGGTPEVPPVATGTEPGVVEQVDVDALKQQLEEERQKNQQLLAEKSNYERLRREQASTTPPTDVRLAQELRARRERGRRELEQAAIAGDDVALANLADSIELQEATAELRRRIAYLGVGESERDAVKAEMEAAQSRGETISVETARRLVRPAEPTKPNDPVPPRSQPVSTVTVGVPVTREGRREYTSADYGAVYARMSPDEQARMDADWAAGRIRVIG